MRTARCPEALGSLKLGSKGTGMGVGYGRAVEWAPGPKFVLPSVALER